MGSLEPGSPAAEGRAVVRAVQDASGGLTLTAVVCTHERPSLLARALRSLLAQNPPADEILVIENLAAGGGRRADASGAAEVVREVLEGAPEGAPPLRCLVEPLTGLDFARNRALHEARGEIVAFLDDDAVACAGWVEETRRAFRDHPGLDACMGRVDALALDSPGARLFEANGGFARGDRPVLIPRDAGARPLVAWSITLGSGCSMAVRRRGALRRGGFDEALDMGDALPGGGDLDMIWRILDDGGAVLYEPRVRALHEHRAEPEAVARQIAEHNRGLVAMLVKAIGTSSARRRLPVALFLGWRLLKPGARIVRRALGRDPLPLPALVHLWRSCWRGLGAYPAARREVATRREVARRQARRLERDEGGE